MGQRGLETLTSRGGVRRWRGGTAPVQCPLRLHPAAAVFTDAGEALDWSGCRWARSTPAVDLAAEMSDGGIVGLHLRWPADKEWIRWWRPTRSEAVMDS
jgi:hypothetical protein